MSQLMNRFEQDLLGTAEGHHPGYHSAVSRWEATTGVESSDQLRKMIWGGMGLIYCVWGPLPEIPAKTLIDPNDFRTPRAVYLTHERPSIEASYYLFSPGQRLSKFESQLTGPEIDFRDVRPFLLSTRSHRLKLDVEWKGFRLDVLNEMAHNGANFNRMASLAVSLMTRAITELTQGGDGLIPNFLPVFLYIPDSLRPKYGGFGGIQIGSISA